MVLPGLLMLILFRYIPIYGIVMAFEKFRLGKGYFRSEWVWFQNFIDFFSDSYSFKLIRNTLLLGFFSLIFGFPVPIFIAVAFNEIRGYNANRILQTFSYLPYFVSTVIIIGITKDLLSIDGGVVNKLIVALGGKGILFFGEPGWFRPNSRGHTDASARRLRRNGRCWISIRR